MIHPNFSHIPKLTTSDYLTGAGLLLSGFPLALGLFSLIVGLFNYLLE